jgi:2-polyprenyl-3-methyl-5-hydroxy-6-metoxy-1,4-benzoquinol methylase
VGYERGERMVKSFKDYEHEGWNSKASQYERAALPLSSQGFEPILKSFGNLKGKKFLDVCTGPGHLAAEAAARGASVDAIDFSEAMVGEAKARFSGIGLWKEMRRRSPMTMSASTLWLAALDSSTCPIQRREFANLIVF